MGTAYVAYDIGILGFQVGPFEKLSDDGLASALRKRKNPLVTSISQTFRPYPPGVYVDECPSLVGLSQLSND
jgi:hypothetical protein